MIARASATFVFSFIKVGMASRTSLLLAIEEGKSLSRVKGRRQNRAQVLGKMKASRDGDAPCFVYIFVLKGINAIKVGVSVDPIQRLTNLPQFHLRAEEVFDFERSVVVFVERRIDARQLERAVLQQHVAWQVEAPCSPVVYVGGIPTCFAPIRWSAGGRNEWLDSAAYPHVLQFLLFANRQSPRPAISMANWAPQLGSGVLH